MFPFDNVIMKNNNHNHLMKELNAVITVWYIIIESKDYIFKVCIYFQ